MPNGTWKIGKYERGTAKMLTFFLSKKKATKIRNKQKKDLPSRQVAPLGSMGSSTKHGNNPLMKNILSKKIDFEFTSQIGRSTG